MPTDTDADADRTDGDDPSDRNVFGEPLQPCCTDPATGALRDGFCRSLDGDPGRHEVCAVVTEEFLEFSRRRGNDLITPREHLEFPGLSDGDRWCLCVPRWIEAHEAGVAPPVALAATNEAVLDEIDRETLEAYAVENAGGDEGTSSADEGAGESDGCDGA